MPEQSAELISAENETRALLILAGEELFAEQGIGSPSVRQVIARAGVGNKSALNYHFGTREGLVAAIVARHGETLRLRRLEGFEAVVLDDAAGSIERLCELLVRPYCQFLADGASELRYLIIAAEVMADPARHYEDLQTFFEDPLTPRIVELMLDQLELPDAVATERVVIGLTQLIAAVAARARQQLFDSNVRERTPLDVFVGNLLDMLVGALTAPVGPATLRALASLDGANG